MGVGDRDILQGGTQKREKEGASSSRVFLASRILDSLSLHYCDFAQIPFDITSLFRGEGFTHDGVPARFEEHLLFLEKKLFFLFFFFLGVKLFTQSKWWAFVHNWLQVLH